jgi:hypothetical protein
MGMQAVVVRPRKFTYVRKAFEGKDLEKRLIGSTVIHEVEETIVAHAVFVNWTSDGLTVQFLEFMPDGRTACIAVVTAVAKLDDGVVVDVEPRVSRYETD